MRMYALKDIELEEILIQLKTNYKNEFQKELTDLSILTMAKSILQERAEEMVTEWLKNENSETLLNIIQKEDAPKETKKNQSKPLI